MAVVVAQLIEHLSSHPKFEGLKPAALREKVREKLLTVQWIAININMAWWMPFLMLKCKKLHNLSYSCHNLNCTLHFLAISELGARHRAITT